MEGEQRKPFSLRRAAPADWDFWRGIEPHCPAVQFEEKARSGRAFFICLGREPVGLLDFILLWDKLPFLNCLFVLPQGRGQGAGRFAMGAWEQEMKKAEIGRAHV